MNYLYLFSTYFFCAVNGSEYISQRVNWTFFFALEIKLTNFRMFIKGEIKNLKTTTINKQNDNLQEYKKQFIKGMLSIILFIMEDYERWHWIHSDIMLAGNRLSVTFFVLFLIFIYFTYLPKLSLPSSFLTSHIQSSPKRG